MKNSVISILRCYANANSFPLPPFLLPPFSSSPFSTFLFSPLSTLFSPFVCAEEDWDDSDSNQSWETESADSDWASDEHDEDEDDPSREVFDSLNDILDEQDMTDRERQDIGEQDTIGLTA